MIAHRNNRNILNCFIFQFLFCQLNFTKLFIISGFQPKFVAKLEAAKPKNVEGKRLIFEKKSVPCIRNYRHFMLKIDEKSCPLCEFVPKNKYLFTRPIENLGCHKYSPKHGRSLKSKKKLNLAFQKSLAVIPNQFDRKGTLFSVQYDKKIKEPI